MPPLVGDSRKVAFTIAFIAGVASLGCWLTTYSATEGYISSSAVAITVGLSLITIVATFQNWNKLLGPLSFSTLGALIGTLYTQAGYNFHGGWVTVSGNVIPLSDPLPDVRFAVIGTGIGLLVYTVFHELKKRVSEANRL